MKKLILAILIGLSSPCLAEDLSVTSYIVIQNSLTSEHFYDDCDPECANENNGGAGWKFDIDYDELHFGVFYMEIINSFGNKGTVFAVEPIKAEISFQEIGYFGIAPLFMRITGYKNQDGKPTVVNTPPIPRVFVGAKPFSKWDKNFSVEYNIYYLPNVRIEWVMIRYIFKFD